MDPGAVAKVDGAGEQDCQQAGNCLRAERQGGQNKVSTKIVAAGWG